MKEAVSIIRNEILALKRVLEKTKILRESIQKTDDAKAVKTLAKETENSLTELLAIAAAKEEFLKKHDKKNMEEYLEAQMLSETREVVMRLLSQAKLSEKELAEEIFVTQELLKRLNAFVDFNINVMASVKADTTYGPPGKSPADGAQKIFEANI